MNKFNRSSLRNLFETLRYDKISVQVWAFLCESAERIGRNFKTEENIY